MANSTKKKSSRKTSKPHPEFPLFRHSRGYWAKKIRGNTRYFGKIADDPDGQAAINLWLEQKDALLAGRTPRVHPDGFTINDLADKFMQSRRHRLDSGELTPRSYARYFAVCKRIVDAFGKRRLVDDLDATDFEQFRASMAKTLSPITLGNEINSIRVVFRYATENHLVAGPVRYGSSFKRPNRKVLRQVRAKQGARMFEAAELKMIIDAATIPLKAMILLGINCGFGNTDMAQLPIDAVDLKSGWVSFPRPKTGVARRCPLWPETVAAIRAAIEHRPKPKADVNTDLLFVTKYGRRWASVMVVDPDIEAGAEAKMWSDDPVCKEFSKLLTTLKLKRPGLGFYALRHGFETIGGDSRDQVAVDAIMGHVRDDMASLYRERIEDDRLKAVTDHVHQWLFPVEKKKRKK